MKIYLIAILLVTTQALLTSRMVRKIAARTPITEPKGPVITTSCNRLNLTKDYSYSGIVASGYLTVGKNNSALAYMFYGKKDLQDISQLRSYPTILWLNGGPGSSSQMGNFQELGPLLRIRQYDVKMKENNYTWVNNYNVLFVDQPIGTGLSYADTTDGRDPFAKSLSGTLLFT